MYFSFFHKKNIKSTINLLNIFCIIILFLTSGCKATEAKPSGFIKNPQYMYKDPSLPFHKVWIRRGLKFNAYRSIIIKPVSFDYLHDPGTFSKVNFHGYQTNLAKNKQHLSAYTSQALVKAFRYTPGNRFRVTNRRSYSTLVLKMAIVEFVPTKSVINTATTGAMFVPLVSIPLTIVFGLVLLPIKAIVRGTTDSGFESSIAIEAVLCDSVTNKVLVAFKDRVSAPSTIINLDDYKYWAYIHQIIDKWAIQIVQLMNRKNKYQKVKGHKTFTIKPW